MISLTRVERRWVKFHGDRGGEGPLTLGQRNTYQWIGKLGTEKFLSMDEWVFRLPPGAMVDDVAQAWQVLMCRHESLRTTFPVATGPGAWPRQRVAASGELLLELFRAPPQIPAETVERELIGWLRERPFELGCELPVRVAVAVGPGGVCAVVAVFSHMAVDFAAMAVLGRQFTELAGRPDVREVGPRGHQPLDQAADERSPRGRARAEAALAYWRRQLRQRPQVLFAVPASAGADACPSQPLSCWLRSPAAALALPHITARTGASAPMAVLAAVSAVLAHRTGNPCCMFVSPSSNRFGAHLRDYVGTIAQDGLLVIDTATASFDELVRRAGTSTLRAHRCGTFDAVSLQAIHDQLGHERGVTLGRDCSIDNLVSYRLDQIRQVGGTDSAAAGDGPAGSPGAAAAALDQSTLGWWEPPDMTESLRLQVVNLGDALHFTLWAADTRRVPRPEFVVLLRGIERLLVAAAGGDQDLSGLSRITRMEPAVRDGDWLFLDSCWVELPAVQRLVDAALPGTVARVFAVPGPGGPVLTAYLAVTAAVGTPRQAHDACMRALPGRPTAMAPARYVLCGSAPPNPASLARWQHQPVLTSGEGRAPAVAAAKGGDW